VNLLYGVNENYNYEIQTKLGQVFNGPTIVDKYGGRDELRDKVRLVNELLVYKYISLNEIFTESDL